ELTLRLRPVPDAERWVYVCFDRLKDAGAAVRALMGADLVPCAVELLDADAGRFVTSTGTPTLVIGFDGLPDQVDWQCGELASVTGPLGGHGVCPLAGGLPPGGFRPHASVGSAAAVMRFSVLPTLVAELMEEGASVARERGLRTAWTSH